jgi:hypothetical protein
MAEEAKTDVVGSGGQAKGRGGGRSRTKQVSRALTAQFN